MSGVAPSSRDGGGVGHEAVHGGTKSETGADLQEMTEEDSLGVLIRDRGVWSHHSLIFLTLLRQAWEDLAEGGGPPRSSGNHRGSRTRANPQKSKRNGQPLS